VLHASHSPLFYGPNNEPVKGEVEIVTLRVLSVSSIILLLMSALLCPDIIVAILLSTFSVS
jgi:hypothetical protein